MKFYLNKTIAAGFILFIVIIVLLTFASFQYIRKVIEASERSSISQQILLHTKEIMLLSSRIESLRLKESTGNPQGTEHSLSTYEQQLQQKAEALILLTSQDAFQSESAKQAHALIMENISRFSSMAAEERPRLLIEGQEFASHLEKLIAGIENRELELKRLNQASITDRFYKFITTLSSLLLLGIVTPFVLLYYLNLTMKARVRAEENLKSAHNEIYDLYENAPCGYLSFDQAGMVSNINKTLLGWMNNQRESVIDRMHAEQIFSDGATGIREILQRVNGNDEIQEMEFYMARKGKPMLPVILNLAAIKDRNGDKVGTSCSVFDNTYRKIAEAETKKINSELEAFSYSVSHDLRAPLRSINGYVEIMHEDFGDKLEDEAKDVLKIIANNAKRMGNLIDDLLNFSKLGRQEISKARVDMSELVRTALEELIDQEKNKNIEIEFQQLPATSADASMIRQVWFNLLSNALKYSRNKERPRIQIGAYQNEQTGEIVYFVKDNGAGFDMKYVNKLFGVFQRLHRANEFEGTGVGLALVKKIIDRHNGNIWAEAKEDEGATFYFSLPYQRNS